MISPLTVFSKNVKVSQKRCLGTSIESFTGSSPSEQIIGFFLFICRATSTYRNREEMSFRRLNQFLNGKGLCSLKRKMFTNFFVQQSKDASSFMVYLPKLISGERLPMHGARAHCHVCTAEIEVSFQKASYQTYLQD